MNTFQLPLIFQGAALKVLLVGGGVIAHQKYSALKASGVSVEVVAQRFDPQFIDQLNHDGIVYHQVSYERQHLDRKQLVVAATSDRTVNTQIVSDAREASVMVNCVDQPDLCDCIFPAIIRRGPVIFTISSQGTAPALSAWLRRKLEQCLPHAWSPIFWALCNARENIKQQIPALASRKKWYQQIFSTIEKNTPNKALSDVEQLCHHVQAVQQKGKVSIVGAGPGSSQMLTLEAVRVLGQADVVLYDSLVHTDVLDYASREARCIHVGCRAYQGVQDTRQQGIHTTLLRHAQQGSHVVRLKGGDPSIFARTGEEIDALKKESIEVEVIAGISAFQACAAAMGIALTHRQQSSQLHCISGHDLENKSDKWWRQFHDTESTWVLYMAAGKLSFLITQLSHIGVIHSLPIAIIENASLANQSCRSATLEQHYHDVQAGCLNQIQTPALIIIGFVIDRAINCQGHSSLYQQHCPEENRGLLPVALAS